MATLGKIISTLSGISDTDCCMSLIPSETDWEVLWLLTGAVSVPPATAGI